MVKFGPAGVSQNMRNMGVKKSPDAPEILKKIGLDAFEYQCGNGVRVPLPVARELGENCIKFGITPSVHAPYYISLSSVEEEKREKSIDYILQTARVAAEMGAKRIVVHSGSCAKISREEAFKYASETLLKAVDALKQEGLDSVHICPETMGKINQLGTLSEVVGLCEKDESLIPCVDFGHLNARTLGGIKTGEDYEKILDEIENVLGYDRLKYMHCHFSKIEYTTGGEKRHLTFEDKVFGPDFEPLAELFYKRSLCPTVICESSEVMDSDALKMKTIYDNVSKG